MRSLRTVYSAINSEAFSNRSGGIEGRPTALYICANSGESSLSATSASALISLIGWLVGTRFSGFTKVSIVLCGRSNPRIFLFLLNPTALIEPLQIAKRAVDPIGEEFLNILLGRPWIRDTGQSAHPAERAVSLSPSENLRVHRIAER